MLYFVTCGRGFESFVIDELKQILFIKEFLVPDEGKILFCAGDHSSKHCQSCRDIENLSCNSKPRSCVLNRFRTIDNDLIATLLNLKLVEKIFIVLSFQFIEHYKDINNISMSDVLNKLKIDNLDFGQCTEIVKQFKRFSAIHTPKWIMCRNLQECPAMNVSHHYPVNSSSSTRKKLKVDSNRSSNLSMTSDHDLVDDASLATTASGLGLTSEAVDNSFRVSCRVRGQWKHKKDWNCLNQVVENFLVDENIGRKENDNPSFDVYVNLNDTIIIAGVSLSERPLSLRPYMAHIALRSTVCYLMLNLSNLNTESIILDPMCGAGTILLEAVSSFKVFRIIANDLCPKQLNIAKCNLRNFEKAEFIRSDAKNLPLLNEMVDAVFCDFPFGKKFSAGIDSKRLLLEVLKESSRIVKKTKNVVFLVSKKQSELIDQMVEKDFATQNINLELISTHFISLGLLPSCILVFLKTT